MSVITRINVIPVNELSRQHLIAEWREIHRIYGMVEKAISKDKKLSDFKIPTAYTLGAGHMWFFGDKLLFILQRQRALRAEMVRRGYQPGYKVPCALDILARIGYLECMGDYTPTAEAMALNRERIEERNNG